METTLEELTAGLELDIRGLIAEAFAECETREQACRLFNDLQDAIIKNTHRRETQ